MISLLILVLVVGLLVWVVSLLPLPAPFQKIIVVLGVIIVVAAILSALFGIDVLGHLRSLR
jgi:hypothetical protein